MRSVEVKRRQMQMLSCAFAIVVMWILGKHLNNIGLVLLAIAIECSAFFIVICSEQLSDGLGKLLRSRQAKRQYRNVNSIRRNIGIVQSIAGLCGSLLLCLLAKPISSGLFHMEYIFYPVLIISPLVFLRVMVHLFLGYFQGEGNELPAAAASFVRQILILLLGLTLCGKYTEKGIQVSELLKQDTYKYVYGAMGVSLAIVLAEFIILVLLITLFFLLKRGTKERNADSLKTVDSTQNIFRVIYINRLSTTFLGLLKRLPFWVCLLAAGISVAKGSFTIEAFGLFWVKYLGLIGILAFVMLIGVLPLQARAVQTIKNEGPRYASQAFNRGMLYITSVVVFAAVYLTVMREQIAKLLSNNGVAALSDYFRNGALLLAFVVLTYYFTHMLYMLGQRFVLIIVFVLTGVIFSAMMLVPAVNGTLSIVAVGISVLLYAVLLCIVTGFFACRMFRVGLELLIPLMACILIACVAGLLQMGLNALFAPHLGALVTLLVVFILTFIPFVLGLLFLRVFREGDFENLPGGRILLALGQMLHLY